VKDLLTNVGSGGGAAAPAAAGGAPGAAGGDAAPAEEEKKEEGLSIPSLINVSCTSCFADTILLQRRRSPTRTWVSVSSTKQPRRDDCFLASLYFNCIASGSTIDRSYRMERAQNVLRYGQSSLIHII
jgi:hypothetical protein